MTEWLSQREMHLIPTAPGNLVNEIEYNNGLKNPTNIEVPTCRSDLPVKDFKRSLQGHHKVQNTASVKQDQKMRHENKICHNSRSKFSDRLSQVCTL